jgi:hypothetical protein
VPPGRDDGCAAVVATPHQRTEVRTRATPRPSPRCARRCERAGPSAARAGRRRGAGRFELLDELERSAQERSPVARRLAHLLLEFHRAPAPSGVDPFELLHELVVAGWADLRPPGVRALIAADADLAEAIVERGGLFQLTAMSVTGESGGGR